MSDTYGETIQKPDWLSISKLRWHDLSISTQKTVIEIGDDVVANLYLKFDNLTEGWQEVQEQLNDEAKARGDVPEDWPGNSIPDYARSMHESIDPMGQAIWGTMARYVESLKNDKRRTIKEVMDLAVERKDYDLLRSLANIAEDLD